jgi:phosphoribosylanthranilate isomerase
VQRTRIKFCGITRPQDAVAAATIGADAIGLVLHADTSRRVTVEQARKILAVVPPFVTPVALFVDSPPEQVLEVVGQLKLRHVQLHGRESPEMIAKLGGLRVIKALHVERATLGPTLATWRTAIRDLKLDHIAGLLLETSATTAGGTGVENDWDAIAAARSAGQFEGLPPIIAAGGLTPANVGDVVRRLRPYAVDVSSGIEITRGIKSVELMRDFAYAVQLASS